MGFWMFMAVGHASTLSVCVDGESLVVAHVSDGNVRMALEADYSQEPMAGTAELATALGGTLRDFELPEGMGNVRPHRIVMGPCEGDGLVFSGARPLDTQPSTPPDHRIRAHIEAARGEIRFNPGTPPDTVAQTVGDLRARSVGDGWESVVQGFEHMHKSWMVQPVGAQPVVRVGSQFVGVSQRKIEGVPQWWDVGGRVFGAVRVTDSADGSGTKTSVVVLALDDDGATQWEGLATWTQGC